MGCRTSKTINNMKTAIVRKRKSVTIQYLVNGKQIRLYTGMAVEDNEWNKKQKSVNSRNPGYISINQTILKIRGEVETYLIDLKRNNLPYVHSDLKNLPRVIEGGFFVPSAPKLILL